MWDYVNYCQESKINYEEDGGLIPKSCAGKIEFKNVDFSYPSRKDVKIMKGLTTKYLFLKFYQYNSLIKMGNGRSNSVPWQKICLSELQTFYEMLGNSIDAPIEIL